ncbi:hypothetical protein GRI62_11770 [Erythrobacter arachoides]|uniref:Uncharacterized protein n=1 Tax=Aurantiacibacter arachoides TaxID=1850444 RepID=A0A845A173_9SPHN|nr:hypothetical protein [Aurantiacibacter arachoides]MXO94273.1 hypothetical protein [Aurantiacibacter arachoides]GGD64774.1 hypothetical protein GCM10011411_26350 [Aurantiacibacter arachoides]
MSDNHLNPSPFTSDVYVRDPMMGNGSGGYRRVEIGGIVRELEETIERFYKEHERLINAVSLLGYNIEDDGQTVTLTK